MTGKITIEKEVLEKLAWGIVTSIDKTDALVYIRALLEMLGVPVNNPFDNHLSWEELLEKYIPRGKVNAKKKQRLLL